MHKDSFYGGLGGRRARPYVHCVTGQLRPEEHIGVSMPPKKKIASKIAGRPAIVSAPPIPPKRTAVDILQEISVVDQQIDHLTDRHNLLLRDLREKAGKSFRHDGRVYQIRNRGGKFYLAEMQSDLMELDELPEAPAEPAKREEERKAS